MVHVLVPNCQGTDVTVWWIQSDDENSPQNTEPWLLSPVTPQLVMLYYLPRNSEKAAQQHIALQVISVSPDLHLMISVNWLLSPPSEASDSVPTLAIFLLRSHGYVWHARVEVRLSFTCTAHWQSLQQSGIWGSAWAQGSALWRTRWNPILVYCSHVISLSYIFNSEGSHYLRGGNLVHLVSKQFCEKYLKVPL